MLRQGSIWERNYFAMIKITSLGGSGEDSRNCFYVQGESFSFLLDCGVRREIADVSVVYPLLTEKIARSLDAVFLSHAHEDHTAALPYPGRLRGRVRFSLVSMIASSFPQS